MLGDKIKQLREELEISQEELANKLNLSASTIGMYEINKRQPNNDILINIANYFDVSVDYLLGKSKYRNEEELQKKALDEFHKLHEKELMENKYYVDDFDEFYENYKKLNELGKEKTNDYIKDLSDNTKYTDDNEKEKNIKS